MSFREECHNFIKVLLSQHGGLFVCGTNAFNPLCANYTRDSLEMVGETVSGMARCPYDPRHANVALFAEGSLFTGTVTDFLAIDAVIYRSLGDSPALRTVKHDSKWFREPFFVSAVEWGPHIYFFFREMAMEFHHLEKVMVSRVARVCKGDMGGSQRVLEKQWTSFLKARLNCSVPGDSHFYFNLLHATSPILNMNGRDVILGLFSTPPNSIPGSAVCVFDMQQLARVFEGRFKEQKSPESIWTPVPDELVPKPRPGGCAVQGSPFSSSKSLPDDVLNFVKTHPLMDETIPLVGHRPWVVKTMGRYQLTAMVVDTEAGPHRNRTVLFLGSTRGTVLKFLILPLENSPTHSSVFLEENLIEPLMQLHRILVIGVRDYPYDSFLLSPLSPTGVIQQSLLIEPESLVSLNLLVASAVSAFTIGAALSGLAVCWIMAHKPGNRRHGNNTPQSTIQRQERGMLTSGGGMGGSVLSVTRQGGGDRPCSQGGETLFVMPNGWGKSGELDPGFLPTPEHTPQQKRRGLRLSDSGSGGWDNSQTYLGGSTMGLASPCPLPCPPHPSTAVYLTTRLFQGGGGGRHGGEERGRGGETPRQHYVCLSKPRGEKGRSGTPKSALRKSAGEYVYPMTPQDSPDRRRVVSAPSAPMEFGEPLPLRWPPQEGYILSSQGMVPVPPSSMPTPNGQQYVAQHHTPGPGRAQLRGALGRGELGELVDLSQLLSKKSSNERTHNGQ
uniref:Sema domain-containing protein n=1 Tax=Hucho hucho TaxID=62062 RepID=A0A4W5PKB0_9TELE